MADVTSPESLWSRAQVAAFFGVPERTVETWRLRGTGPRGVRVGRHVRWDPNDVRRWFEGQKAEVR